PPRRGWFARLRRRWVNLRQRRHLEALPQPELLLLPSNVDFSLRQRASVHAVRSFIESVDTYELHNRKTVHVVSHYEIPVGAGLEDLIPEWLAHRVRFGTVQGDARDASYLDIRAVDVVATDEGTELYLHLTHKVEPGTRAFVAAWLGEGDGRDGLQDAPSMLIGQ
ncbi:MAG: hypothetical protein KDA24_27870, partial [Deltaproteobacteria bacterium]|nr:hypothetical protein [Deltaproteobacteria bacterium]